MPTLTDLDALLESLTADPVTYEEKLAAAAREMCDVDFELEEYLPESNRNVVCSEAYIRDVARAYPEYSNAVALRAYHRCRFFAAMAEAKPGESSEYLRTRSRDQLVLLTLPIVLHQLNKYSKDDDVREDIIQESVMQLYNAIDRFEWERGIAWATYCCHWIRFGALQTLYARGVVRRPVYMQKRISKILAAQNKLGTDDPEAVAAELGVSQTLVLSAYDAMSHGTLSLDVPTRSAYSWADVLDDGRGDVYDAEMEDYSAEDVVKIALKRLPDREQFIIRAHFGIEREPMSQNDIAKALGIHRERVRQLRVRALETMHRHVIYALAEPHLG